MNRLIKMEIMVCRRCLEVGTRGLEMNYQCLHKGCVFYPDGVDTMEEGQSMMRNLFNVFLSHFHGKFINGEEWRVKARGAYALWYYQRDYPTIKVMLESAKSIRSITRELNRIHKDDPNREYSIDTVKDIIKLFQDEQPKGTLTRLN